jgi:hypothetical protein
VTRPRSGGLLGGVKRPHLGVCRPRLERLNKSARRLSTRNHSASELSAQTFVGPIFASFRGWAAGPLAVVAGGARRSEFIGGL